MSPAAVLRLFKICFPATQVVIYEPVNISEYTGNDLQTNECFSVIQVVTCEPVNVSQLYNSDFQTKKNVSHSYTCR